MKRYIMAGVTAVVLCAAQLSWGADIKIASGGPFIETIIKPVKEAYEKASGNKIVSTERGFKLGMLALESGEIDLMGAGVSPEEFEATLKKQGCSVADPSLYKAELISEDQILVAVNKANSVAKLDKQQLKSIFTGKVTNWKDVGGTADDIIVVWVQFMQGPNQVFSKKILDEAPLTKDVLAVNGMVDARATVSSTPQAIMIYPSTKKDANLKYPETPVVTRPTIIITKGTPSPAAKSFIDYVKAELAKKK